MIFSMIMPIEPMAFAVALIAFVHETLVILYTRGIGNGSIPFVMLMSGLLGILISYGTIYIVEDHSLIPPLIFGHMAGVPVGMLIRIKKAE